MRLEVTLLRCRTTHFNNRATAALLRRDREGQALPLPNAPRVRTGLDRGSTAGRKEPRRRESKHRVGSSSGSNHNTPYLGEELLCVRQVEHPGRGQGKRGAGRANITEDKRVGRAGTSRRERDLSYQEEGATCSEEGLGGTVNHKGGDKHPHRPRGVLIEEGIARDGCHKARGTKAWKNPIISSRQNSNKQPITGSSVQPKKRGSETGGRGDQCTWKAKA